MSPASQEFCDAVSWPDELLPLPLSELLLLELELLPLSRSLELELEPGAERAGAKSRRSPSDAACHCAL